jgi:hypothetical protein
MVRRCHFHARPNANLWMEFRRHGHARLANEVAKLVARVPRAASRRWGSSKFAQGATIAVPALRRGYERLSARDPN